MEMVYIVDTKISTRNVVTALLLDSDFFLIFIGMCITDELQDQIKLII